MHQTKTTRCRADRTARVAVLCALGITAVSLSRDLAPKLTKFEAQVGLRDVRSTNPSSSMVDDAPMDGRIDTAGPDGTRGSMKSPPLLIWYMNFGSFCNI